MKNSVNSMNTPKKVLAKIAWESGQVIKPVYYYFNNIYFSVLNHKVDCNICGYKGKRFSSDGWHLFCACPQCNSHIRHRLFWAALTLIEPFTFDKLIKDKSILHFAPEKATSKKLKDLAHNYKSSDFFADGLSYNHIDYNLDMSDMNIIKDDEFDCVIAFDVLEHVPKHLEALKETYRILKKGGYAIFTIPQPDNWDKTIQDLSDLSPKEREIKFGQYDHLRLFGTDFLEMLQGAGFTVTVIDAGSFDKEIVQQYVLYPPVKSSNPLATNNRKIYFAKK